MASSDVISGGLQGGMAGASAGSVAGPWGAVIGGVVGTIGGAILGGKKKKPKIPKFASSNVYGYDTYGNLVNKGSYFYNKSTGRYELRAGELSSEEKAMRQNLGANIANLINTVGTTPDAFVRYAKELADSYYKQGERRLSEQYDKAQSRIDENLAKRGMSTSRAAADISSELQGKRFDTLADIYDASQRYGYDVQRGLQGQATGALSTLAGYQSGLSSQDMNYLQQALKAQQLGQAYENMKTGMQNQQIAQENQNWQNVLDSMTSLGGMMGYAGATKGAGAAVPSGVGDSSWMSQGTAMAMSEGPMYSPSISSQNQLSALYNYKPDYASYINF